jgi:CHAD domain-containing protein
LPPRKTNITELALNCRMVRKSKQCNEAALQERLFWVLNQLWRDYLIYLHECTLSAPRRAVHGLRTTIRKMNAALELLCQIEGLKSAKKLHKQFKKTLRSSRFVRDLQIQKKWIENEQDAGAVFLADFQNELRLKLKKQKKKFARSIARKSHLEKEQENRTRQIGLRALKNAKERLPQTQAVQATLLCIEALVSELKKKSAAAHAGDHESVHAVRVALKKYRYAIDALGSVYPISSETLEQIAALQKQLGQIQDLSVLIQSLKKSRHKRKLKQYSRKLSSMLNGNIKRFLENREALIEKIVDISAFYLKEAA